MQHRSHNSELRDHARLLVEVDQAKAAIRLWPGLSAADKWAWEYLAIQSRMGRELISTTAAAVAGYEGRTHAAGLRRLTNLAAAGLIAVRGDGPTYEVELLDHTDLPLPRVDWDGQLALFEDDDPIAQGSTSEPPVDGPARVIAIERGTCQPASASAEMAAAGKTPAAASSSPADRGGEEELRAIIDTRRRTFGDETAKPFVSIADVATEPRTLPRDRRGSGDETASLAHARDFGTSERRNTNTKTSTSVPSELRKTSGIRSTDGAQRAGRLVAEVATEPRSDPPDGGSPFAAAIAGLPSPDAQRQRAEQLVRVFRERVADERLRVSPCLRLAWAIVEGRVRIADAFALLGCLDQAREAGTIEVAPWAYFVGGAKRLLDRAESAPAWRDSGE